MNKEKEIKLEEIRTLTTLLNVKVAYPKFNTAVKTAKQNPITGSVELSPLSEQFLNAVATQLERLFVDIYPEYAPKEKKVDNVKDLNPLEVVK